MIKINIVLTTLNSKFIHSSLALRSLNEYCKKNNINDLILKEYTINNNIDLIVGDLYKIKPDVIGFSCYIWNIEMTLEIISILKAVNKNLQIIVGGPEAYNLIETNKNIDISILGEGEEVFLQVVKYFKYKNFDLENVNGIIFRKENNIIKTSSEKLLDLNQIPFVYNEENLKQFKNKIIYYEASRGCPFNCQYCMSSILKGVRYLSLERIKFDLQFFLDNKIKQVKFVDRTFNCHKKHTLDIWKFLIENDNGYTNFHFEIAGDLLTDSQINLLKKARVGLFQFEIGVQSTNLETLKAIDRKTNLELLFKRVREIKNMKNIHQHLDLIAGLPFEDYNSFEKSFNDVYNLQPEQLQLGFLKVLKETGLRNDSKKYGIVYREKPPYEFLFTNSLSFDEVLQLKNIEEMVDIFYNSFKFTNTIKYIIRFFSNPFVFYKKLADYWEEKKYFSISHQKLNLYIYFLDFCKTSKELNNIDIIIDLLKYDILINDNLKNLPEIFSNELNDFEKENVMKFYNDENKRRIYFSNLEKYIPKQIFRMCNIEKFNYNIINFVENNNEEIIKSNTVIFFNYFEEDSLVIIGVDKSVSYNISDFILEDKKKDEYNVMNILEKKSKPIQKIKKKGKKILETLDKYYPEEDKCYLNYEKPYELLFATILSAQCTDNRVNLVTENLFKKYNTLEKFASADLLEMEESVRSTGFFRNKSKNIIGSAQVLLSKYKGVVPSDINDLIFLPGVGRKTANVVRGHIFKIPSIVVDTHVKRISNKLGLVKEDNPEKIEYELMKILPKSSWIKYNQQVIAFGREICSARRPKCEICFLADQCVWEKK